MYKLEQPFYRAVNSAGECHPHTVEVAGSNPAPPTILPSITKGSHSLTPDSAYRQENGSTPTRKPPFAGGSSSIINLKNGV